jgi:hypothetical protein
MDLLTFWHQSTASRNWLQARFQLPQQALHIICSIYRHFMTMDIYIYIYIYVGGIFLHPYASCVVEMTRQIAYAAYKY